MTAVIKFSEVNPDQVDYTVAPEKQIQGNPTLSLWEVYTDPSKRFSTGLWQGEKGKWRCTYTEEEYCQILEGTSILTDAQGHAVTVTKGDSFVVPKGFDGTWEVVATTKKIYVIFEEK